MVKRWLSNDGLKGAVPVRMSDEILTAGDLPYDRSSGGMPNRQPDLAQDMVDPAADHAQRTLDPDEGDSLSFDRLAGQRGQQCGLEGATVTFFHNPWFDKDIRGII